MVQKAPILSSVLYRDTLYIIGFSALFPIQNMGILLPHKGMFESNGLKEGTKYPPPLESEIDGSPLEIY